jgi:hypothetical protein
MKKISLVNASNDSHLLLTYKENYERKSGTTLSMNYLQQSHTMVFMKEDKMLGGYILNGNAPYRYLSIFDKKQKELLLKTNLLKEEELLEITCNWMTSKISIGEWLYYYTFMIFHTLFLAIILDKRKIIAGSVLPQIQYIQRQIFSQIIYSAFVEKENERVLQKMGGIVMIYYCSVRHFITKILWLLLKKFFSRKLLRITLSKILIIFS